MTMETPKWLLLEVETWDYGDYALGFLVATTSATGKHPSYIDRLPRHFPNLPSIQGWDMTCDEKYANMASRKKRATIATSSKHHGIASSKRSLTYPLGIMFIVEIPELNDFPKPPFFWWISHHARFELPFRVGSMTFKRLASSVTWFPLARSATSQLCLFGAHSALLTLLKHLANVFLAAGQLVANAFLNAEQ